jgi:hypothetical protein
MDSTLLDAAPWPVPGGVLDALATALFALHAPLAALALGGSLAALLAAGRAEVPAFVELRRRLAGGLAPATAFAAASGGGAALSLLARHGREALPAAVIMAWPLVSVVALLAAAAVGQALQARLATTRPALSVAGGAAAALALLLVAFVFTSHAVLSLHPEHHLEFYLSHPDGTTLGLGEPALWPRFLHFVGAALGAGALWSLLIGARLGAEGARVVVVSATGLCAALAVTAALGLGALLAEPEAPRAALLGGDRMGALALLFSALLTLSALSMAWRARSSASPARLGLRLAGHLVPIGMLMAVARAATRHALLEAAPGGLAEAPVVADLPGAVAVALSTLAATAALWWLLRIWRRASPGAR